MEAAARAARVDRRSTTRLHGANVSLAEEPCTNAMLSSSLIAPCPILVRGPLLSPKLSPSTTITRMPTVQGKTLTEHEWLVKARNDTQSLLLVLEQKATRTGVRATAGPVVCRGSLRR